jgi:ABC-type nickel/cobalt efflux system permease component RcnA
MVLAVVAEEGFRAGLVATAFVFGLRHGIDWDHIAAITDITGSQEQGRRSMFLATLYALGHGSVVMVLGAVAVLLGDLIPSGVDVFMERLVGITLIALGVYVFYALLRHGRDFRFRSRWMLMFSGVRWLRRRLLRRNRGATEEIEIVHEHDHPIDEPHAHGFDRAHLHGAEQAVMTKQETHRHPHSHVAPMPEDPFAEYGSVTSFGVGMIHGIGAETPTQVLLFLAAAGVGGPVAGVALLVAFLVGLLVSNSVIAFASTYGFLRAGNSFPVYATVGVLTGVFSLGLGTLYLFGTGDLVPVLFG